MSLSSIAIVNVITAVGATFYIGFGVAGSIYSGQFVGANKPIEAANAVKVHFTIGSKHYV